MLRVEVHHESKIFLNAQVYNSGKAAGTLQTLPI